mgnify:CR=1 FL=1
MMNEPVNKMELSEQNAILQKAKITKGDQTYYIYMEVVTADKEHPENKEIQIIDLATKKAYNDRYFLWHSKKGIFTQEKVCEDYRTMLIFGK